jgi:hypothetical protein
MSVNSHYLKTQIVSAVRYETIGVPNFYRIKILEDIDMRNALFRMVTCGIAGVYVGTIKL